MSEESHIEVPDWSLMPETKKIQLFNSVLSHYREPGPLQKVLPRHVIPDTTNRGNTGLSVEHVHWVATKMKDEGFIPRSGTGRSSRGHDLPIVVRESTFSEFGPESLIKWQRQLDSEQGFPPLRLTSSTMTSEDDEDNDLIEFFGSLGNGHFFQALNLFDVQHPSLWKEDSRYEIAYDDNLRSAVKEGVPAVVLRSHIPRRARKFLSEVLNSSFTYVWDIDPQGEVVRINPNAAKATQVSQFEALSKSLDSQELSALITHALKKSRSRL